MEIEFRTTKLHKDCWSQRAMTGRWGPKTAKKMRRRLADLEAAETLEQMRHLPGRCHELSGDLAGCLALDLDHPYRLIFRPNQDPVPRKPDGGLAWEHVTGILIEKVVDYH